MSTQAVGTAKEVFELLRDDLRAVERELARDSDSSVHAITEIAGYLREGGGKRIRPTLLLLTARALGYRGRGSVRERLQEHGTALPEAMLQAAREPKQLKIIEGAGHNDLSAVGGGKYLDSLADFVRTAIKP